MGRSGAARAALVGLALGSALTAGPAWADDPYPPEGPTTATYSPGSMRRLTPRSASTETPSRW